MITQVEIFSPRVTTSPLPVAPDGNEITDPIQIRNIDGLGPVNATVNTTQYGSQDGTSYSGSSTGNRNIVLTVGLNPNWVDQTPESLRQALYAYFMPKSKLTLRFTSTHMATVEIDGYVESFTPNMFSKDPEYQVSIICPKSEFTASFTTAVAGVTVALPDGDPTPFTYQGTLPTGFVLDITQGGAISMTAGEIRVINETLSESLYIITADITPTKSFEMGTVVGSKYVQQNISGGTVTTLLGKQAAGSNWVQLDEGVNNFRVASAQAGQSWTLEYRAKYGGL